MFKFILAFVIVYMVVRTIRRILVMRYINKIIAEMIEMSIEEANSEKEGSLYNRLNRFFETVTYSSFSKSIRQFYLPIRSFFYKDYILNGDEHSDETSV